MHETQKTLELASDSKHNFILTMSIEVEISSADVILESLLEFVVGTFSRLRPPPQSVTEYINQRIKPAESAQQSTLDALLAVEVGLFFG